MQLKGRVFWQIINMSPIFKQIFNTEVNCFLQRNVFNNIPLQETIDLCVENLFRDRTYVDNLS